MKEVAPAGTEVCTFAKGCTYRGTPSQIARHKRVHNKAAAVSPIADHNARVVKAVRDLVADLYDEAVKIEDPAQRTFAAGIARRVNEALSGAER